MRENRYFYPGLGILLLFFTQLCFRLMKPDVAGFLYDDGMYLMAAKSLATGEGYRLSWIAGQPWFYKYPPLYPLLLAGMWQLNPHFPENIPWLKSLNVLLSMGALTMLALYFHRVRHWSVPLTLVLVSLLATNWRFLEVTTETMSEPLFILLTISLLLLGDKLSGSPTSFSGKRWIALIALSIAAFYTRTMALPLIAAVTLWIACKVRWKASLLYLGMVGIAALPWVLWSRSRPDQTIEVDTFLVRSFQETYFQSFQNDLKYEYTLPELFVSGANELLGNFSLHLFPLLERLLSFPKTPTATSIILGVSFLFEFLLVLKCYESIKQKRFSLTGLYLGFYLILLPFWSFFRYYGRFVVVILPFVYEQIAGCFQKLNSKARQVALTVFFSSILITNLIQLGPYVAKPSANALLIHSSVNLWLEYQSVVTYLKTHTPINAVLYTDNGDESYFYGLNTNRQITDFFVFLPESRLPETAGPEQAEQLRQLFLKRADVVYEMLQRQKVSYVIANRHAVVKNEYHSGTLITNASHTVPLMIKQHPLAFVPVFQSSGGWITVYQFKPSS